MSIAEKLRIPETYEVVFEENLSDIHAEGILLRHKKTGARAAIVSCEDSNKVFNIGFRTPPSDSTGVAHIIEHTVLCGSERFPLKDPFVELMKGSLNTFLNAMTYPDKTMYPVASTNDADFRNLMHVYLDAVFFPNIYREDKIFKQEGWHYELNSPEDDLEINGVVYNEMKGAFSTPDSVLERETMNVLFPDTPYGVESGGDPDKIPELTYEDFLDFHRRYYHPSNSYIYLYGDVDMAEALSFIDENYLSRFDRLKVESEVPSQEVFSEEARSEGFYPISDDEPLEDNSYISYNIVAGDPLNIKEMIAGDALDYVLFSAPGAPVRQAILDAGIAQVVYSEFCDGIKQPYFSVTAKNADADKADEFVGIIRKVLTDLSMKGLDHKSLHAALNNQEFQFREADYSSYPKGLMYGLDMMDSWLYAEDQPFSNLKQTAAFEELKAEIEQGYFENFVKEKLLGSRHAALLILRPKYGMEAEEERKTAEKLAAYKASLSNEDIDRLVAETEELLAWQEAPEKPENIDKLPMLKRDEIEPKSAVYSNEEEILKCADAEGREYRVKTVWHNADTNGIGYLELLYDIGRVPVEELQYLSLLKAMLTYVDTKEHSYTELSNLINEETGGVHCGITKTDDAEDADGYRVFFTLTCKALYPKISAGIDIIREVMTESLFEDRKRISEIIHAVRSALQVRMQNSGNHTAGIRAEAYISSRAAFDDLVSGIGFYRFLKNVEEHFDEFYDELKLHFEHLTAAVFDTSNLIISYTCEESERTSLTDSISRILLNGTTDLLGEYVLVKPLGLRNEGFRTPGKVQFVAESGNFAAKGYRNSGAFNVLKQILNCEYLWQNIRVKGGAYGCGATFRNRGEMTFTSYRDPNLLETREIFRAIPDYVRAFTADEREMTKYIIGTISSVDTPMTPAMLGASSMRLYLMGKTQEDVQKRRDEMLGASDHDIKDLADAIEAGLGDGCFCVIGGEQAIDEAKDSFGHIENLL